MKARSPIAANPAMPDDWVVFTLAGARFAIPIDAVELIASPPPLCRIPHAPPALLGAGNLGGQILPILDPAALLDGERPERRYNGRGEVLRLAAGGGRFPALFDLPEPAEPGSFAVVAVDQQRIFLAVDRVLGLEPNERDGAAAPIDLDAAMPDELRDIVLSFPRPEESVASGPSEQSNGTVQHLTFALGGQDFAVPIAAVERVLGPQPLIALPARQSSVDDDTEIAAAIELRGQIIPVAVLHARLGLMPGGTQPSAFAILRGAGGLCAIAADRVDRLVALRPDEITPQPGENGLIAGVAAPRDGRAMLRVLAPERLWGG